MESIITGYPKFFTATILEWKKLLKPEKRKDIIISSLRFLVENSRVKVPTDLWQNELSIIGSTPTTDKK